MMLGIGVALIAWAIAIFLTLYGPWLAWTHSRSKGAPDGGHCSETDIYAISILKPLKGIDEGLRENLESFFKLDYSQFELLFSISDTDDPAAPVVQQLIEKYPHIPARLMVGSVLVGPNPKVKNLFNSYHEAKNDWILISDSNIRVEPDYLKQMTQHIAADVGVITSVVRGMNPLGVGGHFEALYLNTYFTRGMHLAVRAGHPCVLGKSMLFRRSVAERFGGMHTLGRYLAEDFMAGEAMLRLGLKVIVAKDPVTQYIGRYSFTSFWNRHLRWGRIRKSQVVLTFLAELMFGSTISCLLGAMSFYYLFGISPLLFVPFHLLVWFLSDLALIENLKVPTSRWTPFVWLVGELLHLPLWIVVCCGNTVTWRGRTLKLRNGGLVELSDREFKWGLQRVRNFF